MAYGPGGAGVRPSRRSRAVTAATFMLAWVALLWLLAAIDSGSGLIVKEYGIQPRDTDELLDVFPAAFLHFGWDHVAANTVPLLIFGFLAALRGMVRFIGVILLIVVTSGAGVWLTAPDGTNTAGASGVVFGLFGYLLVRGFVERDALDITVGVTVLLLYGSILWGVVPTSSGVSWQGHLFGLVGGVLAAFWLRRTPAARAASRQPSGGTGPSPWS
ncbi:rhomboid family intramembrane serine protease [Streptomyces sp. TRM 70351]|uniref:rhomboid family intramembrane serine protease n=1 Tax=Streptomyces sp. TRM 70351 TaxID=3116552 RepID=UPI002E7BDEB3|nr:rhomboid family intramembrane serine protease [Streptomyces sp. TRM 70351]MEE1931029.1 rhomboid family intramembrane serine protease [Streptomyces sp. TRM 70351]